MSKKRVTRSSAEEKHQNLIEYQFNEDPQVKSRINESPLVQKNPKKPKRSNSPSQTQQLRSKKQKVGKSQSVQQKNSHTQLSNSLPSKSLQIRKKKVTKQQQNQGLRIIKEKQSQNIFRHFCTPEGIITVESLGSVLVRAKKQFETEDVENMITYFETISRKVKEDENVGKKDKRNGNKAQEQQKSQSIKSVKGKNKQKPRLKGKNSYDSQESVSNHLVSQSDQERSIDQEMELMDSQQIDIKTELNYEQFKLLLKYFDKD